VITQGLVAEIRGATLRCSLIEEALRPSTSAAGSFHVTQISLQRPGASSSNDFKSHNELEQRRAFRRRYEDTAFPFPWTSLAKIWLLS
jgi:hypothetical protein